MDIDIILRINSKIKWVHNQWRIYGGGITGLTPPLETISLQKYKIVL